MAVFGVTPQGVGIIGQPSTSPGVVSGTAQATAPSPRNGVVSNTIDLIVTLTQAEYDALTSYDTGTLYIIT